MPFVSGPKERKSRALGENLFLKAERSGSQKSGMTRRPYPPGMHGNRKRRKNLSEFGVQLKEKQKLRLFFGLQEKQMKRYAQTAKNSKKTSAPEALFRLLESRIDSAVFQSGLAPSRSVARQMTTHGHLALNGRRVNVPSIILKIGDEVSVREPSKNKKIFENVQDLLKKHESPTWIEMDKEKLSFKFKAFPNLEEAKMSLNIPLVVEYYSR